LGGLDRNGLEGQIYTFLFNNQEKTCLSHWKSDEYFDFLSWFYPRLKSSIDSYKETGASFEAFLSRYLLTSSKEYRVRVTTREIVEYSTWSAKVTEMYTHEEAPVYIHENADETITKLVTSRGGKKNTKRILALILKCYYYISDDFAERIAPEIGMGKIELLEMLKKIRSSREKNDDKIYLLKERIYSQYYRCLIYDKRLALSKEDTYVYKKLKQQMEKARKRLENMRNRMMKMRTEASNKQIAQVIGAKKGTVDSNLHQLKSKWEDLAKKALSN